MAYCGNYVFEDEDDFMDGDGFCEVCGASFEHDESFSYGDNEWHEQYNYYKDCGCTEEQLRMTLGVEDIVLDDDGQRLLIFANELNFTNELNLDIAKNFEAIDIIRISEKYGQTFAELRWGLVTELRLCFLESYLSRKLQLEVELAEKKDKLIS